MGRGGEGNLCCRLSLPESFSSVHKQGDLPCQQLLCRVRLVSRSLQMAEAMARLHPTMCDIPDKRTPPSPTVSAKNWEAGRHSTLKLRRYGCMCHMITPHKRKHRYRQICQLLICRSWTATLRVLQKVGPSVTVQKYQHRQYHVPAMDLKQG